MKKCPYCAEQIQDDAIKCRYCGSMLNGAPPPPTDNRGQDAALDNEIRGLLSQRQKIAAIKLVRDRTGSGLKQAKDYVDALEAGGRPAMPAPMAPATSTIGQPASALIVWVAIACAVVGLWMAFMSWHKP